MNKGKVQNPLTIIAIFAGIAEVAGTTVLLGLPIGVQYIFVWFVMAFPLILITAFFLILTFRHDVLYAPSDFQNEQLFMDNINRRIKKALDEANEIVAEVEAKVNEAVEAAEDASNNSNENQEADKGSETVESKPKAKIVSYQIKLNELKDKLQTVDSEIHYFSYVTPALQKKLLDLVNKNPEGLSFDKLRLNRSFSYTPAQVLLQGLDQLIEHELIYKDDNDGKYKPK